MGEESVLLNPLARETPEAGHRLDARARALVSAHFDFIWRLLYRLGVASADVDDTAQNVFLVATRRLSEISEEKERTFLYGTALRMAATLRRNQRRRRVLESTLVETAAPVRLPDEEVERSRALAFLDEVLHELEDELREVFVLCEIEQLSASEVAAISAIPVGTVASRLRRARRKFDEQVRRLQAKRATRR